MKILADENIEAEIVAGLRNAGHSVIDIKETTPGIEDSEVLKIALEVDAILLTNDKDFGELVYREGHYSKGVILIRLGKLRTVEKQELVLTVIAEHEADLSKAFTIVSQSGLRIRKRIFE